jgi:hypothetical protein
MKLKSVLFNIARPDHYDNKIEPADKEVVFDTKLNSGLELLSVYYSKDDDKIHIDIGTE